MAVFREGKSGNGRITLCEPQDGQCQPRYNLIPCAPSNHSEFEGDGARNARTYREHTHTHTHRQFQLYILDNPVFSDGEGRKHYCNVSALLLLSKGKKAILKHTQSFQYVLHGVASQITAASALSTNQLANHFLAQIYKGH